MWINSKYYDRLMKTLKSFSEGDFYFDENDFDCFRGKKYSELTNELKAISEISNKKSKDLDEIIVVLNKISQGDLTQKTTLDSDGKILEVKKSINTVIDISNNFLQSMDEITMILNKVAQGDLTNKITIDADGEVLELKNTINSMVDQLALFVSEVTRVSKEVGTYGKLGGQAEVEGVSGIWLELMNNVNEMASSITDQVRNLSEVTKAFAQGDLTQKITVDAKGELLEVKNTINTMVDQLAQLVSEVTKVAKEVGTDGILGGRANIEDASGIWLDLTNNVNEMATSLTNQMRDLADVTKAIAHGDLTQKITVDAEGELLELKNTINEMVDEFSDFGSEITKVTKEVGRDGKFGAKANLGNTSGIWLDLTTNINKMSESLAKVDKENKEQNWIKDGISILGKEIMYKDSISEQFQIAITHLCRYANVGAGAIYVYDSTSNKLELEASYACNHNLDTNIGFNLGEGVIGQVAYDRKPILIETKSDRVIKTGTTEYNLRSTYTSPLIFKEKLLGVVEIASYNNFDSLQIEFLENALSVLAGSFYASIQARYNEKLEFLSKTDALTKLNNRGCFDKVVPEILADEKRTDGLISFAILDIDYFKNFNDEYGHKIGDKVLKSVAKILKDTLKRDEDYCFRIGGEEFAVVFSAYNKEKAIKFMNKVRERIENIEMKDEAGNILNSVTISIGLVCKRAGDIKDFETMFKEADTLLYKAKNNGRNRVCYND